MITYMKFLLLVISVMIIAVVFGHPDILDTWVKPALGACAGLMMFGYVAWAEADRS